MSDHRQHSPFTKQFQDYKSANLTSEKLSWTKDLMSYSQLSQWAGLVGEQGVKINSGPRCCPWGPGQKCYKCYGHCQTKMVSPPGAWCHAETLTHSGDFITSGQPRTD